MTDITKSSPALRRPRKMAREHQAAANDRTCIAPAAPTVIVNATKPPTKAALVEAMLLRSEGVSLEDLCRATGWQPHTCRAVLTGLRKKGRFLERSKREDGSTIYRQRAGVASSSAAAIDMGSEHSAGSASV